MKFFFLDIVTLSTKKKRKKNTRTDLGVADNDFSIRKLIFESEQRLESRRSVPSDICPFHYQKLFIQSRFDLHNESYSRLTVILALLYNTISSDANSP